MFKRLKAVCWKLQTYVIFKTYNCFDACLYLMSTSFNKLFSLHVCPSALMSDVDLLVFDVVFEEVDHFYSFVQMSAYLN